MKKIKIKYLTDRISTQRPKRILSLDGGGTKGIVTIALLEKLEERLKELIPKEEQQNFRLNQYFDYIGGTSTGSIIAVLLSLGYSIGAIKEMYMALSKKVFGLWAKKWYSFGFLPIYRAAPIEKQLKEVLEDKKLSDASIMNLLAVFTKNTNTNNIWTFNNNPDSKFYTTPDDYKDSFPNKDQYLRDLVRASTAAPIYFPPKRLLIRQKDSKKSKSSLFIDGGVSMENNPAFRLFLMATVPYYRLKWHTGEKEILLLSFGTGLFTNKYSKGLKSLLSLPDMYMKNASQTTDTILRGLSKHKNDLVIDKELKDIAPKDFDIEPRLTYLRYNFKYRGLPDYKDSWAEMDKPKNMEILYDIAKKDFEIDIKDIPDEFLSHYYDWDNRLIDGRVR